LPVDICGGGGTWPKKYSLTIIAITESTDIILTASKKYKYSATRPLRELLPLFTE
jgi:hypothetical protein